MKLFLAAASAQKSLNANYYPVLLNLKDRKIVIIGGGKVAERKTISLLKYGADITVVSPMLTKRLLKEKEEKRIRHVSRIYNKKDLKGAFLVVAATDSQKINKKVANDTPALVNVADVPSLSNFISPSIIKRGPLIIAVSTSGTSPALSKAVRKELERMYGSEFSAYLKFLKRIRLKVLTGIKENNKREKFLKSLASDKIVHTLREKGLREVKKIVSKRFDKLSSDLQARNQLLR